MTQFQIHIISRLQEPLKKKLTKELKYLLRSYRRRTYIISDQLKKIPY